MNREDLLKDTSPEEKNFADFQEMLNNVNTMGAGAQFIKKEDLFRIQILLIHLFVDNLFEEIIRNSPVNDFVKYKKRWTVSELSFMGFSRKLEIIMSTGKFDKNFRKSIVALNDIRNDLAHKIKIDLMKQKKRIEDLEVQRPFKKKEVLSRPLLEQLEISVVPYINVLFEYLILHIKKQKLNLILGITIYEKFYEGGNKNLLFILNRRNENVQQEKRD
ncbi:hypothetical protein HYV50_01300 [Candidatus Pacearchaeota archaeon]|nr:hypothetical protein [Candidatus Pacearchaeota archaeon]